MKKHNALKRILSLVLTLTLLLPLLSAAVAEETERVDNGDLGPEYAGFDCYLGCDELYEGALDDLSQVDSPVPSGGGALQGIGTFILSKTADFLFNKALDKIWAAIFGGDDTAEQLAKIIEMLKEIQKKLDEILERLKSMEYCRYMNERMILRTNLYTEVKDTLDQLQTAEDEFKAKKITQAQLNERRKQIVIAWGKKTINGSNSAYTATLAFARQMMQIRSGNLGYYGMVDAFAYNYYPFQSAAYAFREEQRSMEIMVYSYAAALSAMALKLEKASVEQGELAGDTVEIDRRLQTLKEVTDQYDKFFTANKVDRSGTKDYEVLQMKGMQGARIRKTPISLLRKEDYTERQQIHPMHNIFEVFDEMLYKNMRRKLIPADVVSTIIAFFNTGNGSTGKPYSLMQILTDIMGVSLKGTPFTKDSLLLTPRYEEFKEIGREKWVASVIQMDVYGFRLSQTTGAETRSLCCTFLLELVVPPVYMTGKLKIPPETQLGLEYIPSSRTPEPEAPAPEHLSGIVMHVDSDTGYAHVLGTFDNEDGSSLQAAIPVDLSAGGLDYPPVNGLNVELDYTPNDAEDGPWYTASAVAAPDPVTLVGTVSLCDEGALTLLDEDGAEHAFVLNEALAMDALPELGQAVAVTYVPVTPVADWLAEDYDESLGTEGIILDENAPTEYVLSLTLGEESDSIEGVVTLLTDESLNVADDQGLERSFLLAAETQMDEGVAEGSRVRVTFHTDDATLGAEPLLVADRVELFLSPVNPDDETEELDGVILDADDTALQVLGDDGEIYDFDITDAKIEGEPATGNTVHVVYAASTLILTAKEVYCFNPDDDQDVLPDDNDPEDAPDAQQDDEPVADVAE